MKEIKIENWYDTLYIKNLEVYDDVAFVFVNTSEDHPNLRKIKILNDTLKQCHNMTSNLIYLVQMQICDNEMAIGFAGNDYYTAEIFSRESFIKKYLSLPERSDLYSSMILAAR